MRVTKRIEAYINDEVNKIANAKREEIRAKYADAMKEFEDFIEEGRKEIEELNTRIIERATAKGYKLRRYYDPECAKSNMCSLYNPINQTMDEELSTVTKWVEENASLICVKLEMGGDMKTLSTLLDELRKSL